MKRGFICLLLVFGVLVTGCQNQVEKAKVIEVVKTEKIKNEAIQNVIKKYKNTYDFSNFSNKSGEINIVKISIGGQHGNFTNAKFKVEEIDISKNTKIVIFSVDYGVGVVQKDNSTLEAKTYRVFEVTHGEIKLLTEKDDAYVINLIR